MRIVVTAAVGLFLLLVVERGSVAAEPPAVPQHVLQEMNVLVGKWEVVAAEGEGSSAMRTLSDERVWAPGQHCLITTWTGERDGVKLYSSAITGWNQTTNQVIEHWYTSDGSWFDVCYPVDKMKGSVWEGTTAWLEPDGRKIEGTCRLEKNPDGYAWIANWMEGGKKHMLKVSNRRIRE